MKISKRNLTKRIEAVFLAVTIAIILDLLIESFWLTFAPITIISVIIGWNYQQLPVVKWWKSEED